MDDNYYMRHRRKHISEQALDYIKTLRGCRSREARKLWNVRKDFWTHIKEPMPLREHYWKAVRRHNYFWKPTAENFKLKAEEELRFSKTQWPDTSTEYYST